MCRHGLPIDNVLRNALLIRAYGCDNAEGSGIDLLTTVADDADDHFPPTVLPPGLAAITFTQVRDVLHDAVHGPRE